MFKILRNLMIGILLLGGLNGCLRSRGLHSEGVVDYSLRPSDLSHIPAPEIPAGPEQIVPATVAKLDRPPRYISLAEAIAIALEQGRVGSTSVRGLGVSNEDLGFFTGSDFTGSDSIRVFSLVPAAQGAAIEGALGRYDAVWFSNMNWTTVDVPVQGLSSFQNGQNATFNTGIAKPLPTGGSAGLTLTGQYSFLTSPPGGAFSVLNPSYTTKWQLGFEQPLLRNNGVGINQLLSSFPGSSLFSSLNGRQSMGQGILIARIRYEQQKMEFERRVNFLLLNTEVAYWNLYSAYVNLYTTDTALRMAYEVWRLTNEYHRAGRKDAKAEKLYGARGQYEFFRASRLQAIGRVLESERTLRQLLGMPVEDGQQLVPIDAPTVDNYQADWTSALYDAMTSRPELEMARQNVKTKQLAILTQKNFLLPDLRLQATYGANGLGSRLDGSEIITDANGAQRFNNSLRSLFSDKYNDWTVGINMTTPIGYRVEHALLRQARLELAQSQHALKEQESRAIAFLANQYSKLAETYRQIEPRRAQRENYGKQIEDRLLIFALQGPSEMPLDFLQGSVSQWATALNAEYQAIVDYNIALATFEFAKGTLMKYDNVLISEGPWPHCVGVRAAEHERERSFAFALRERANAVNPEIHHLGGGRKLFGLPLLPRRRGACVPALFDGHPITPDVPTEVIEKQLNHGPTQPVVPEPQQLPYPEKIKTVPIQPMPIKTTEPPLDSSPTLSPPVLLPDPGSQEPKNPNPPAPSNLKESNFPGTHSGPQLQVPTIPGNVPMIPTEIPMTPTLEPPVSSPIPPPVPFPGSSPMRNNNHQPASVNQPILEFPDR